MASKKHACSQTKYVSQEPCNICFHSLYLQFKSTLLQPLAARGSTLHFEMQLTKSSNITWIGLGQQGLVGGSQVLGSLCSKKPARHTLNDFQLAGNLSFLKIWEKNYMFIQRNFVHNCEKEQGKTTLLMCNEAWTQRGFKYVNLDISAHSLHFLLLLIGQSQLFFLCPVIIVAMFLEASLSNETRFLGPKGVLKETSSQLQHLDIANSQLCRTSSAVSTCSNGTFCLSALNRPIRYKTA